MKVHIELDFKTILAIFLLLVIIFIIFSNTNNDGTQICFRHPPACFID